jgi:hypothetical protein
MTSALDSATEGVHDTPRRGWWSSSGMARRPEFGAVVATVLVYLFFAITTQGAGFVSIDGTAGWLDTSAELGIIAIPVGVVLIQGRVAASFRRGEKSSVEVLSLMAGGEHVEDVTGEFAHLGENDATAQNAAEG